ncbi:MAG: DUF4432 family protein, partial [Bythopirellula sp.]
TNVSDEPSEFQILYHTNFGIPLLKEGAQVLAAVREVAPFDDHSAKSIERWYHCEGPTPGFVEQCYFLRPIADDKGIAEVMLRNSKGDRAVCLSFNVQELPYLTIWKNFVGVNDGYVVGLEPGTSFPNRKSFERDRGRAINLAPSQTYCTWLRIDYMGDSNEVAKRESAILKRQEDRTPRLHKEKSSTFSPDQN